MIPQISNCDGAARSLSTPAAPSNPIIWDNFAPYPQDIAKSRTTCATANTVKRRTSPRVHRRDSFLTQPPIQGHVIVSMVSATSRKAHVDEMGMRNG
jgi:hypothetical protein